MKTFVNPIVLSDIPDPSVIRVGDVFYMTSTTMYFTPGCPVMKSYDLVNWEIVGYVYDTLSDNDHMTLTGGKHDYGRGSWASSLRYHNGTFYVSFVAYNTGLTYIYQTEDIENGPWRKYEIPGIYHDMSLLFDDDGRVYMVYGAGAIKLIELTADATGLKPGGLNKVIIDHADPSGTGSLAEGCHIYKLDGKYYIFIIAWPRVGSGRRLEVCYRADAIDGVYEGRVVLDDNIGYQNAGVAQGGIVDAPCGQWFAFLFQDHGAVGRVPVLVPMAWEDGWPVLGVDGKVPAEMPCPLPPRPLGGLIHQETFDGPELHLNLQWNHNPVHGDWSLAARPGWLRLTTGHIATSIYDARNTLTKRTFGPKCSVTAVMDAANMKDGDVAGLVALQDEFSFIGVRQTGAKKQLIIETKEGTAEAIHLSQDVVYLTADFDFTCDKVRFSYSYDGGEAKPLGGEHHMSYKLSHFTGYRIGLFNYATSEIGGYVDFDGFSLTVG
ncbi:MAG: glycoside hydrolase 43 family protein [Defluviitaleaceae bacterium]|nr:glycoside hydrolase 43 family protein [Defluviitaleaceae bacterium]